MRKSIFLSLFAVLSFAFTADAQSCCSKKAKASCHAEKAKTTQTATDGETKAVLIANVTTAAEKTEKFTVYGNCGMCKRTIEGALTDVKGISSGEWNIDTDVMTVSYDEAIISLDDIKQKIADVGYDTDTHRAKTAVYESLPGCCQYDRPTGK